MEKATISLSFDDGRADNYEVIEKLLRPMGIPVTLNITTGYVDGSCPEPLSPSVKSALSVEQVCRLADSEKTEIALHGDRHLNTWEDILSGKRKLLQWMHLPENHPFGFASPGSGMKTVEFVRDEKIRSENQILYLRTSLRNERMVALRILCRKAGRILHLPVLYRIAYADTLMTHCEDCIVYSVPVMRDTTFEEVKAIVDLCVRRKAALTLMFHSILPDVDGEDNWSWSWQKLERLCRFLKEKKNNQTLRIVTTKDLVRILREGEI